MLAASERDIRHSHAMLGLAVAGVLVVGGAVCRINWKFLPFALYAGIVVAWGSAARKEGIWWSCALAVRSLLTGIVSIFTMSFFLLVLIVVWNVWSLVVSYQLDVSSWLKNSIPDRKPRIENVEGEMSPLPICVLAGSGFGIVAGLAALLISSRPKAALGAIGGPVLWLTMYWSETFKPGAVAVPTQVPLVGTVDGGLVILYLSTLWFALGGWLGDRIRTKRLREERGLH
jgi:hypothetical protein